VTLPPTQPPQKFPSPNIGLPTQEEIQTAASTVASTVAQRVCASVDEAVGTGTGTVALSIISKSRLMREGLSTLLAGYLALCLIGSYSASLPIFSSSNSNFNTNSNLEGVLDEDMLDSPDETPHSSPDSSKRSS